MPKSLRVLCVIVLAYLIQTTIVPRFSLLQIKPDVMLASLVWVTADGDRYVGFTAGVIMGLIMDAMVGLLPFLYLLSYPIIGYASARVTPTLMRKLPFPKKIGRWISREHFLGLVPSLTAAIMGLISEAVLVMYRYLNGVDLTLDAVGRSLRFALYTAIAAFFAQFMVRPILRYTKRRSRKKRAAHI